MGDPGCHAGRRRGRCRGLVGIVRGQKLGLYIAHHILVADPGPLAAAFIHRYQAEPRQRAQNARIGGRAFPQVQAARGRKHPRRIGSGRGSRSRSNRGGGSRRRRCLRLRKGQELRLHIACHAQVGYLTPYASLLQYLQLGQPGDGAHNAAICGRAFPQVQAARGRPYPGVPTAAARDRGYAGRQRVGIGQVGSHNVPGCALIAYAAPCTPLLQHSKLRQARYAAQYARRGGGAFPQV